MLRSLFGRRGGRRPRARRAASLASLEYGLFATAGGGRKWIFRVLSSASEGGDFGVNLVVSMRIIVRDLELLGVGVLV